MPPRLTVMFWGSPVRESTGLDFFITLPLRSYYVFAQLNKLDKL